MTVQHRPPPGKYKLTIEDFLRLDESGVFGTDRTELLDGDIIIMNAEYRPHAWISGELGYRIRRALEAVGSDLYAMSASVALPPHDLPLPDLVLTREPRGAGPIPLPSVALVMEISSSTLRRDAGIKASAFAKAEIAEYWIADVSGRTIRQMWAPVMGRYGESREIAFGERLTAATIAGLVLETTGL